MNPYSKMSMGELLQQLRGHMQEFAITNFDPPVNASKDEVVEYYAQKIEAQHKEWSEKYRKDLGLDDETPKDSET